MLRMQIFLMRETEPMRENDQKVRIEEQRKITTSPKFYPYLYVMEKKYVSRNREEVRKEEKNFIKEKRLYIIKYFDKGSQKL